MKKISLSESKHKMLKNKSRNEKEYWEPKHQTLQLDLTNGNTKRQNKFIVNKENHARKEVYITISHESRLEKVKVETEKIKPLLPNKLNEQIYAGIN